MHPSATPHVLVFSSVVLKCAVPGRLLAFFLIMMMYLAPSIFKSKRIDIDADLVRHCIRCES